MQITVFGASGKVGRRVVELALRRGHTVIAVVHSHDPFNGMPHLVVQHGDIHNDKDITAAIEGSRAVISTLGSWGTPGHDVLTSAMKLLIPAIEKQQLKRLITLTGTGVADPNEPLSRGKAFILKVLAPFPAGKVFSDGEQHLRLLAASSLDWTTVCSPVMNNIGKNDYRLDLKAGNPLATVTRQSVAIALLDQLEDATYIRKAPAIYRK